MQRRLVLPLILALPLLAAPAVPPAGPPTAENLQRLLAQDPQDALALLNLAVLRAREGRRAEVLGLLQAVGRAPGGLDPADIGSFSRWKDDPAFLELLAGVRRAHPPVVRSRPAWSVREPDLNPEGMAFDPVDRAVFVGSAKGKIVKIDGGGVARDFAQVSDPGHPRWVLGLHVDRARRCLWAVADDPGAWTDPERGGSALLCFDLRDGRRLARVEGPPTGALNDLVVDARGQVYTTNSSDGSVWLARRGAGAVEAFLPPGSVPEANGIALDVGGRALFVAGWHDIARVDLRTRRVERLPAPPGVIAGNLDGLYLHRGTLVGIQNGVHPGRILRFHLDRRHRRILRWEILESYHPEQEGLTTGALDGDDLLFLRNTQMRSFDPAGIPLPGRTLKDIVIARLGLR